ncbi:MAG: hypothetical protein N4A62_20795 [Marinisporobacter sp.]|nr:hypothetical protein [Marinisporobacter sp.]
MEQEMITVFKLKNWILFFLLLYFFAILLSGWYYSKKVQESDDLVLAGRGLTYPFLVASTLATWMGAGIILGGAGEAFTFGMQGVIFDPFSPMITLVLTGLFFAYRLRKAKYTTIVDFYTNRYSEKMGAVFVIMQFLAGLSWIAGELVALGVIIHLSTGFSMNTAVFISTLTIIIVILLGGLWALSRADAISITFVIISLLIMIPFALKEVGGIHGFIENASNYRNLPAFALIPVSPENGGFKGYSGIMGFTYFIAAWAVMSLGDLNNSTLITRALAAKNEKTAAFSFITSGLLYLFIGMIPVFIGMSVYIVCPDFPINQAEHVLPWFANKYLPPWISVFLILSLAAVVVSGTGNNLLSASTLIGHNAYRLFKKDATNKNILVVIRIAIVVLGLLSMSIGIYFKSVYKLIVFAGALLFPTTTISYIGGLFWKKSNTYGAFSSFICGLVSWIMGYILIYPSIAPQNIIDDVFFSSWAMWDTIYISAVPAFIISIIAFVIGSLVTQKIDPPKPMMDADGNIMDHEGFFFWSKKKCDSTK